MSLGDKLQRASTHADATTPATFGVQHSYITTDHCAFQGDIHLAEFPERASRTAEILHLLFKLAFSAGFRLGRLGMNRLGDIELHPVQEIALIFF